jgi:type II secretory pathway component PulC
MKKSNIAIIILIFCCSIAALAFNYKAASIKGWVTPKEAGVAAWAISKTDTFKTHITSEGVFEIFNVKPGTYAVVVQATTPYKSAVREGVIVTEGSMVDVGEIKLEK